MKIILPNNKHIGIIMEPRSGSHALREYVISALEIFNLGEFLNPYIHTARLVIDKNKRIVHRLSDKKDGTSNYDITDKETLDQWIEQKFSELDDMTSINEFGMFSIIIRNLLVHYPEIVKRIQQRPDMYFIRLKRADVLYSIISLEICKHTNIWHNKDQVNTFSREQIKNKIEIPLNVINDHLEMYIKCEQLVEEIFGTVPEIYYEQWQNRLSNISKIIQLPNRIIPVGYQKFVGNYKNLISNIDEIEDHYERFVNENYTYFPQYFGKLPGITIPEFQGRQPRNLLSGTACGIY
jgi:hypothetical protein